MEKFTHTLPDGSTQDFFPQSYTDAAVATALAAAPSSAPTEGFVPTETQVQAAVDAGIIAAYTPVATS